ncbi:hypothetical protein M427DRAFT_135904 [Gonapodya prolifera JEL478]|uniref:Uncharacterized protein n=1 Tax=Gonapodya prolifera (strain JEL478) TaxID=1344416 RepID=A0A139ABT2_GONPJ|nr:hypothetical protein M427DRAFT_135904 [Gonapodya prolifera JEL478]|eukprot:KXS14292.1 hypothetical protein M427DRAFT_135904 [Gonapodya prolifera JEL478]
MTSGRDLRLRFHLCLIQRKKSPGGDQILRVAWVRACKSHQMVCEMSRPRVHEMDVRSAIASERSIGAVVHLLC